MILRNRCAWIAAALVFLTAAYFRNTNPGWNVNSQFALTLAVVEQGTLRIDDYHNRFGTETEDKAFFNGHFYSDKSPVTPFLGVPALAVAKALLSSPAGAVDIHMLRYWTTVGSIGICAGILTFLISVLLAKMGLSNPVAAVSASLWMVSTPLLGYSILFFNYLPACTFALGGFLLLWPFIQTVEQDKNDYGMSLRLLAAGFLIGLSCWTLQTLVLFALILTIAILFKVSPARLASLWPWVLGLLLGVIGYAIYSLTVFGEITSPYRYEFHPEFKEPMAKGLMGAGWPRLEIMELLTLHAYRGLFFLFPCTLFIFLGLLWLLRNREHRTVAVISLALFFAFLLYNSGYYMWWGGWTYAPRHLIPALPLLAAGMVPFFSGQRMWRRPAAWILLAVFFCTALMNILVISVDPQPPAAMPNLLLFYPHLVERWFLPFFNTLGFALQGKQDINWGMHFGLSGLKSLFPLGVLWTAGLGAICLSGREKRKDRASRSD